MDKDCAIARDLMPQVIDHVASDESKTFVEEHTAGCPPCTQVYADMKTDIRGAQTPENAGAPLPFKTAMSQLKKTLGWRRLRTTIIAVLATVVVLLAAGGLYYMMFRNNMARSMPLDLYTVSISQHSDGSIISMTEFTKNFDAMGPNITTDNDGEILYVNWLSSLIPVESEHIHQLNPSLGMTFTLADDGTLQTSDNLYIRELRQGTPGNYVVVYRAGDEIAQMSPAMDAYISQEKAFDEQFEKLYAERQETSQAEHELFMTYLEFLKQWKADQSTQPTVTSVP